MLSLLCYLDHAGFFSSNDHRSIYEKYSDICPMLPLTRCEENNLNQSAFCIFFCGNQYYMILMFYDRHDNDICSSMKTSVANENIYYAMQTHICYTIYTMQTFVLTCNLMEAKIDMKSSSFLISMINYAVFLNSYYKVKKDITL